MKNRRNKKIKNLRLFLLSFVTAMTLSMTGCGKEAKELHIIQEQNDMKDTEQQDDELVFDIQTEEDYSEFQSILSQNKSIQSLTIHSDHINIDLSFLENYKNLTVLSIEGPVVNTYYLSKCTKLNTLHLKNAGISNVQFLSELKNLESLNLSGNYIKEIDVLENLTNLLNLNLNNNPTLEEVGAIANCKELRNLNLSKTNVRSLSELNNLTKLSGLYLNYVRMEDFHILESFEQLQILQMNNTGIEDLSVLKNLQELECLDLAENNISDPTVLCNLQNLKYLQITNNYISEYYIHKLIEAKKIPADMLDVMIQTNNQYKNVAYLKVENSTDVNRPYKITIIKLEDQMQYTHEILTDDVYKAQRILEHNKGVISVILEGISIEKKSEFLNSIKNPDRLKYLYLGQCEQEVLSYIPRFKNLKGLGLQSCILDLDFIKDLTELEDLQIQGLDGSVANHAEYLQNLLKLKTLYLTGCKIEDVDWIGNLCNLESITLYNNEIENIDALERLTLLKYLDIRKNNIQDISSIYQVASQLEVLALSENCIPSSAFLELEEYKIFISEEARNSQRVYQR